MIEICAMISVGLAWLLILGSIAGFIFVYRKAHKTKNVKVAEKLWIFVVLFIVAFALAKIGGVLAQFSSF